MVPRPTPAPCTSNFGIAQCPRILYEYKDPVVTSFKPEWSVPRHLATLEAKLKF